MKYTNFQVKNRVDVIFNGAEPVVDNLAEGSRIDA